MDMTTCDLEKSFAVDEKVYVAVSIIAVYEQFEH